jgi:hypothetical protein
MTTNQKKSTKSQVVVRAKQVIAGTAKHLASTQQIVLSGSSFTPDQITSKLQQLVTLRSDVDAAKATAAAKIVTEKAQAPALTALLSAFESFVKVSFGTSPDVLADFGLVPKARATVTAQAKAAAAVKSAATRAARHTMGSRQKQGIKGDVTGVLMTPITAPPPVVTAPAPSAPTAPATSVGNTATGTGATPHTA